MKNLALQDFSDTFWDYFEFSVQKDSEILPKNKEELDHKIKLINRALEGAAEEKLEPRERIERTFEMPNGIYLKFNKRDELN